MPSTVTENVILRAALELAGLGLKVVPLYPKQKRPRLLKWQLEATSDEEKIEKWWTEWPDSNVGVQMGQASGIIDIECDSDEAEKSLLALFDNEFPDTWTFKSKRGKHRLFQWRGDLPFAAKATHKIGQIDFKIGGGDRGSQSVFPPSVRQDGGCYEWVIHPSQTDLAVIGEKTMARLWNIEGGSFADKDGSSANPQSARLNLYNNDTVPEGQRDNTIYAEACAVWREKVICYGAACLDSAKFQGDVLRLMTAWNRGCCVPPLSADEVRIKVDSARQFISKGVDADTERKGRKLTNLGLEIREGEWWPGEWSVELVEADLRGIKLHVPFHEQAIELEMVKYDEPKQVHLAILHHTGNVCLDDRPGFWSSVWNGSQGNAAQKRPAVRGIKAKLLDVARRVPWPPELKKRNVVAEFAWGWLSSATSLKGEPSRKQKLFRDDQGNICFKFSEMLMEAQFRSKEIGRNDLSKVLRKAGAGEVFFSRARFMIVNPQAQAVIESMASEAMEEQQ